MLLFQWRLVVIIRQRDLLVPDTTFSPNDHAPSIKPFLPVPAAPMTLFSTLRPRLRPVLETLAWVPFGILFTQWGYSLITIRGTSMQPTFNPHGGQRDTVLLNRWVGKWAPLSFRRGDVVTLRDPTNPGLRITKRILALEGDVVRTLPPYPDTYVVIPPFHAWVEGDEPFRSSDSNHFGPVSLALVDARVEWILWPLTRARPLKGVWQAVAEEREGRVSGGVLGVEGVEGRKGSTWRPFWNEVERARARMERVYVGGGMVGSEGWREVERLKRSGGDRRA
ncbi:LexA/Signal peptidase [Calocera viscosa TUFC12733]|uniref:Mitochondrial inner membrane protease subunit 2 n=1 Tax=Calocera viscosa (strain TUFC12733) TaxID=1330018 RepID=A0A167NXM0_CALVF|nr:LexA/Signal peptidase [Calocera viscosa TUFC12733]